MEQVGLPVDRIVEENRRISRSCENTQPHVFGTLKGSANSQRKRTSLIEALLNCIAGVGIAIAGQIVVFPWFGLHVSLLDTGEIALIFTGISIVRSYLLRRLFEYLRVTGVLR